MNRKTLTEDVGDTIFAVIVASGFFGLASYLLMLVI